MGLSEGWPGEAERLAARLQRWAAACSGYRKLRSCRISRGRQTMAHGPDSDEDAAVSVGVGVGAGAGAATAVTAEAVQAAAVARCLHSVRPPRRTRPHGIKMFLTVDEQAAIADAKSARPKHTVAQVTGKSSGSAAGMVVLAEQRVQIVEPCRPVNRVVLIQRPPGSAAGDASAAPTAAAATAAAAAACDRRAAYRGIARPRPACPHAEPLLPLAPVGRKPPAEPATGSTAAAPTRRASLETSPTQEDGLDVRPPPVPAPPALCVETAEDWCGMPPYRQASTSDPEEQKEDAGRRKGGRPPLPAPPALRVETAEEWCGMPPSRQASTGDTEEQDEDAGRRQAGRIEVSLYSGGSQREDILSVSVEEPQPQPQPQPQAAMVRGCGVRKTAPAGSGRRPPPSADKPTAGDPATGQLVTRVDPRGRRELWWVSSAPPASPTPAPRGGLSAELAGLLSFRRARRLAQQQAQQLARRRVVAAADAADRRQWPAVLLTFERGVSPEPGCGPPSPHDLLAARKARLEIAAV